MSIWLKAWRSFGEAACICAKEVVKRAGEVVEGIERGVVFYLSCIDFLYDN
jgi:hypothetical protein